MAEKMRQMNGGPVPANAQGIFVPQPKGAGESLDESGGRAGRGQGDVVTTLNGDYVVGKVLSIESGGKLRLTGPNFEGEVVILAPALDRIEFAAKEKDKEKAKGIDYVTLSNGDRIAGELAAITPEAVLVESKATGPLKIARSVVQEISFARTPVGTLESAFDQGKMEPWTSRGGGLAVSNGALNVMSHGNATVFAKFDQKDGVTMEAKLQSTMGNYVNCDLVLFASDTNGEFGTNSIVGRFSGNEFYLMWCQNGGCNSQGGRPMGGMFREGTLRVAYDPNAGKARAWLNSADLGEYTVPFKPAEGRFVMFVARYPCRVLQLRVMEGIVAPTGEERQTDETETHLVRFANKDRVSAADLALADGKITLKTGFGDVTSPVAHVQSVAFRTKGAEKPRRRKGDALVETTDSRFTLQFERLTEEHLVGTSAALGEVKVRRDCLKAIRFNIYK